ncbi:MAG: Cytochrome c biogenesis ATP-binding export protein CcmA [Alphaproteobacteria bacterium MarineAlpha5_Bin11]|nr:MAG: Cytochrome c biogenesis ATP-binding export protein CcmA [Alphaproteobacteria bacterium MarineAlpha5_Bin11]PPR51207.1 MAG: Cytochrome c biogenesis ATP-binding export protein CcmA [Alphaproteobacteria bacterium MarineAlpha5_Bin10]|tara:strand:- start:6081 stop:6704 length:624 start_codon:yes stop_codon:yes gene_type:complete
MILANNITCRRGSKIIFRNLDFKIEDGIATIISGKNGSGKTSLLRIVCNLLVPKSGEIIWKGKSIYKNLEEYYKNITYIADNNCSKDNLTVIENMNFWKRLYGSKITYENFMKLIDSLNLREYMNQKVLFLSYGQKRKLELTRLIIEERNIWILDEPFLGLDQDSINIIGETISDHLARKGMAIFSSHIPVSISKKQYIDLDLHESN